MERIDTSHVDWMDVEDKKRKGWPLKAIATFYHISYSTFINRYNKEGSIFIEREMERQSRAKERAAAKERAKGKKSMGTRSVPTLIAPTCYRIRGDAMWEGRPKRCPVCGAVAMVKHVYGWYKVQCTRCYNKTEVCGENEEEAVRFWNEGH